MINASEPKKFFALVTSLIAVTSVLGCMSQRSSSSTGNATVAKTDSHSNNGIMNIARQEVLRNDSWAMTALYCGPRRDSNGWSVAVWLITGYDNDTKPLYAPNGHRLITIDRDGRVTEYARPFTYAVDDAFMRYFGEKGVAGIDAAVARAIAKGITEPKEIQRALTNDHTLWLEKK